MKVDFWVCERCGRWRPTEELQNVIDLEDRGPEVMHDGYVERLPQYRRLVICSLCWKELAVEEGVWLRPQAGQSILDQA